MKYTLYLLLLMLFLVFSAFQVPLINYLGAQLSGQLRILWKAQKIENVLEKQNLPEELAYKLRMVQSIKHFAHNELGLAGRKNYTTYYNQHGNPLIYVVEASEPFSLSEYKWKFPIAGTFSYKGFFKKKMAEKEAEQFRGMGYDVDIRDVDAYSTLGILKDPVFSEILKRDTGRLAEVLIHELTHATVFVKDSMSLNENLATFIGEEGARLFLRKNFGENAPALQRYNRWLKERAWYAKHFKRAAKKLKHFYNKLEIKDTTQAKMLKRKAIATHVNNLDTIPFRRLASKIAYNPESYNNTFFTRFLKYHGNQDALKKSFKEDFNNNLYDFIKHWEKKLD